MIRVEGLSKTFRRRRPAEKGWMRWLKNLIHPSWEIIAAVDNVSFSIPKGEIAGYIGANGAGKSTTIKCLTGILVPTTGYIEVAGLVPYRQRVANARNIGVVFGQKTQLWWDVAPRATLEFLRVVWDVPRDHYEAQLARFDELLELGDFIDTPVRQLSLGQRMRAELAATFLHDPPILFLDEPTIGMDFESKERLRAFITQINREKGVTIFLASHDLEDIDKLATRLLIIDKGKLVYEGSLAKVRQRYVPFRTLVLELSGDVTHLPLPNGVNLLRREGRRWWLQFPRKMTAKHLFETIMRTNSIHDFTIEEPRIEDVVRAIKRAS